MLSIVDLLERNPACSSPITLFILHQVFRRLLKIEAKILLKTDC